MSDGGWLGGTASDDGTGRYAGADAAEVGKSAELLLRLPYTCWHYGDSVAFEGLIAATDVTGDGRFAAFAHGMARGWAARDPAFREQDNTAPGLAMVHLAERTGDGILLEAVARLADALCRRRLLGGAYAAWERSPLRQPYGSHPLPPEEAALVRDGGPGVFVDCLHFDPPLFAAFGRAASDPVYAARAVEQALAYVRLLQDDATGLFHHFWLEKTGRPHILGWGRGQGWALLGLLDTLDESRGQAVDAADRSRLEGSARRLAAAMRDTQRADGAWHAVAHDPTSGDETSTAAFMATAFARGLRQGVLDASFVAPAARALAAARAATDGDGVLRGVSAAVWACTLPAHYANVPRDFLVPWGQGPLVLALAEASAAATPPASGPPGAVARVGPDALPSAP